MNAVARIPLARVPAREAPPKKLRDDSPKREFDDELETTKKFQRPVQTPTAEQMVLAGVIVPEAVKPEAPIAPFAEAFAQVQAAQPAKLALVPSLDMPVEQTESEEVSATPLEQAVIDLLDNHEAMPSFVVTKPERDLPAPRIAQPAPVVEIRELPEQAAPTSHVNLIMDDGDRRVVVTVAVRGNDVNVHLRGGDDVAAGLARNAGSLDEAMRARGLSLADFTANRDPDQHDQHERPQYERRETVKEAFTLEETV